MTGFSRRFPFILWLSIAVFVVVALLPWWRNHGYLRDLYDYGLVIAANGHLNLGERPYVDFTTPIQAGFLGLSWMFERMGGGAYTGLTLGAAALIVLAAVVLPLMLARRLPWWAAIVVGAAVTVSAASQHTILWHNALGVIALALATWGAAIAPVLRRGDWGWHLLAAAGLFLGGINKLNYSLVAVAVCAAWSLRAGFLRQAGWGRTLASLSAIVAAGVIAPIAAELVWTGATPRLWLANVVTLPAGARTDILAAIFTAHFWVHPVHDYYGPLLLPQVGVVALWLVAWALAGCWPNREGARWDRAFVPAAALLALGAGAALLATNYEIAPLGLGAWLALVVSVWLGFAPALRPGRLVAGLVAPALVLGVAAWWSAWLGQRSQFGYSGAPRASYVDTRTLGPAFRCLQGLRLPPDVTESLAAVERSLPEPDAQGYRRVFYSLGTEWLQRCFPSRPEKSRPLWVHWGTSYSREAVNRLGRQLADGSDYKLVLATIARNEWPEEILTVLQRDYFSDLLGPTLRRWTYRGRDFVNLTDSFETIERLGGNIAGPMFHQDTRPVGFRELAGGVRVMGTSRQPGSLLLMAPSYRLRGVAVLGRLPGADAGGATAELKVTVHGAIPEDTRWRMRLELPPGEATTQVPFEFDTLGKRVEFWTLPGPEMQAADGFFAGFRDLELTNSIESPAADGAPRLRNDVAAETPATPELAASLFGTIAWRPQQLVIRDGQPGEQGLKLTPGGEVWIHTDTMTGEISGQIFCPPEAERLPRVRVVWYKGGRLQLMQHGRVEVGRPFDFRVWTAEPGGWIGILVDREDRVAPVQMRVQRSTLIP